MNCAKGAILPSTLAASNALKYTLRLLMRITVQGYLTVSVA